jgi:hypothetical protein
VAAAVVGLGVNIYLGPLIGPFPRLMLGGGIMSAAYLCTLLFVLGERQFIFDLVWGLRKPAG